MKLETTTPSFLHMSTLYGSKQCLHISPPLDTIISFTFAKSPSLEFVHHLNGKIHTYLWWNVQSPIFEYNFHCQFHVQLL